MAFTSFKDNTNSASSNVEDARKIFVGGLSWGTTEDDLKEYFKRFGEIIDVVLKVDSTTGRSRGFGFVLFQDEGTVDSVLAQTHTLQGRTIQPQKVKKNSGGGGGQGGYGGGRGGGGYSRGGYGGGGGYHQASGYDSTAYGSGGGYGSVGFDSGYSGYSQGGYGGYGGGYNQQY